MFVFLVLLPLAPDCFSLQVLFAKTHWISSCFLRFIAFLHPFIDLACSVSLYTFPFILLELLRLSFSSVLVESYLIMCRKNRRLYIKYHPDEKVSFCCLNRDRRLICNISCNDVWDSLFLLVFFHRAHIDLFRGIDFYLPRQ